MQSIQILMSNLESSPQWRGTAQLRQILAAWPQLVGPAVAQHSQPTKIHRHALQVTVSSASWSQNLMFERSRILHKLHQALPTTQATVRDLRFSTAEWQRLSQTAAPSSPPSLSQHPSWTPATHKSGVGTTKTVAAAFAHWEQQARSQLAQQSQCPHCQSPCPSQEIHRWHMCSICIAQQWHTPQNQNRQL
ncbi:MAG: DciA family protein [Leptolyngbyaceae cyanobacterium]